MAFLVNSAINNPTYGPRGPPPGITFPGKPTAGINAMRGMAQFSIPGMAVSKLYTGLTDFNTGFVANRSITNVMGADYETTQDDDFFPEVFLFAGKGKPSRSGSYGSYPLKSIYKVNQFLRSEKGRRAFGKEKTYDKVLHHFRFVGAHKVGSAQWQRNASHERAITTVIAGRIRTPDIFRCQKSQHKFRKQHGTTNEGDYVWLVLVRCKLEDEIGNVLADAEQKADSMLADSSSSSSNAFVPFNKNDESLSAISPYYWKYEISTTHNRMKPPVYFYSRDTEGEDDYVGYCQFVGRMGTVNGDRNFSPELCNSARCALEPTNDYKQQIVKLPFVEMHLATH